MNTPAESLGKVHERDGERGPDADFLRGSTPFAAVTPGIGPRHIVVQPNGRWVYVITEMGSTAEFFYWNDEQGLLSHGQSISTLPADFHGVGDNQDSNNAEVFHIDLTIGELTAEGAPVFVPGTFAPRFLVPPP
jgi:6-phosphogluconolactonase (cycloisomerase 2 family)